GTISLISLRKPSDPARPENRQPDWDCISQKPSSNRMGAPSIWKVMEKRAPVSLFRCPHKPDDCQALKKRRQTLLEARRFTETFKCFFCYQDKLFLHPLQQDSI